MTDICARWCLFLGPLCWPDDAESDDSYVTGMSERDEYIGDYRGVWSPCSSVCFSSLLLIRAQMCNMPETLKRELKSTPEESDISQTPTQSSSDSHILGGFNHGFSPLFHPRDMKVCHRQAPIPRAIQGETGHSCINLSEGAPSMNNTINHRSHRSERFNRV